MECYEGATMIKTFRGLIVDNGIDTILLHTNDGSTGYRIVKFELMFTDAATSTKSIVQIWKTPPTAGIDLYSTIDFSNNKLLAVAIMSGKADQTAYPEDLVVTFDRETFNQDIYITHNEVAGSAAINYYLELEQVKLDLSENTLVTLKNIKNEATVIL